jgi:dTDP-4-amino-4,6-dideoxygalactose transaminase
MIPRHSLLFNTHEVLALGFRSPPAILDVEKAYARSLEAKAVLLFPSVRSGIRAAVEAVGGADADVVCPAYACKLVHQALSLTGASIRLVDAAPGSFLMPIDAVGAASRPNDVLVFCENYGIPYEVSEIDRICGVEHRLRLFDMAMSIPSAGRMQALRANDVALYSFGWSKPMYAGSGAIVCLQDSELAEQVRRKRDSRLITESWTHRLQSSVSLLWRSMLNERPLLDLAQWARLSGFAGRTRPRREPVDPLTAWSIRELSGALAPLPTGSGGLSGIPELPSVWTMPMAPLGLKLALHNLRKADIDAERRREQAQAYWDLLGNAGVPRGTTRNALPQSHFPLRVPASVRDGLYEFLLSRGIGPSTFSWFSPTLRSEAYPNAACAADELVALPMGSSIRMDQIPGVVAAVKDGLARIAA